MRNPLANYPRTTDLAHWINEREAVRLRRAAGMSPPWTNDPDIANVRYCNVHREDDKITKYIRASSSFSGATVPVWAVVLARMVNRISSLEAIKRAVADGDLGKVKVILKERRAASLTIWGNAYTISTCGKSMDKVDYVVDWVVQGVQEAEADPLWCGVLFRDPWALSLFHSWLTRVDGLGSFLAAQVVADLKNTPGHALQHAQDWFNWCAPGPGSLKGLQAFYGRASTPGTFANDIEECYNLTMPLVLDTDIHMQDFQNCLCEFSKYIRVREGGHARNKYVARD